MTLAIGRRDGGVALQLGEPYWAIRDEAIRIIHQRPPI